MVTFVDAHRAEFGVEPICTLLQLAPSTYYATKTRPPSARAVRDARLRPALVDIWKANYCVYGVRKLWKAAQRAGLDIGRDQTARLMRAEGIEGARRTKRVRTTRADDTGTRHPDLVRRDFTATAPNQLWVTDLTYVPTWVGVAYVCFIIDAHSRTIVGWRVAAHMRTPMVLEASRRPAGPEAPGFRACDATPTPAASVPLPAGSRIRQPTSAEVGRLFESASRPEPCLGAPVHEHPKFGA